MTRALAILTALLVSLTSAALAIGNDQEPPIALEGYSVVSYFTAGRPEQGSPLHAVDHDGRRYLFTDEAQQARFEADPDRYLPRYEICPFSLTMGQRLPLDPQNFRIVGGYLLLFHKSEEMDGLVKFDESGLTDEELIERADRSLTLLTF